jgi:hypothetical protein
MFVTRTILTVLSVFYGLNNVHLFLSMLLKPAVNLKMT